MKLFNFLKDDDRESRIGGSEKGKSTELDNTRDYSDRIEKGNFGQVNESRLPDFEHTPPAPSTPPPPTVDKAGSEGAE